MKHIDIITIIGYNNYGNRLQNYAVQEIFRSLGFDVATIIPYRGIYESFRQLGKLICEVLCGDLRKMRRTHAFKKFNKKYLRERRVNVKHIDKMQFEYIALGGDQIWGPYMETYGIKGYQFGSMTIPQHRIPISPSFGRDYIEDADKEIYRRYLSELNHISVREQSGADIIYNITGRNAEVLIDPVMAIKVSEWKKIFDETKHKDEEYILTCFIDGNNEEAQLRERFKIDYRIYNLCDKTDRLYTADPTEMLSLIYNAKLICTDSFHCTAFSILFKKAFVVFNRETMEKSQMTRLFNLLDMFKLKSRHIDNLDTNKIFEVNYKGIDSIIANERNKFFGFLRQWS